MDQVRRVTLVGVVGNVLLSLVKIISGKVIGSISLVADGIHSLSDLFTDLLVFVGSHFSDIPPDENHPYGHGKIETMIAIIIALVLISVGLSLLESFPDLATVFARQRVQNKRTMLNLSRIRSVSSADQDRQQRYFLRAARQLPAAR